MYLFVRRTTVRGLDAQKWSVDIGNAAAEGLGVEVGVWSNVLSPGVGTTSWTSRWSDLSSLEKGLTALMGDAKYLGLAAEGQAFVEGAIDDTLFQIVYEGSGEVRSPSTPQPSARCVRRKPWSRNDERRGDCPKGGAEHGCFDGLPRG